MALDSDHDRPTHATDATPFYREHKGTQYPRLRIASLTGEERRTARANVDILDDDTLASLSQCAIAVRDFMFMRDSFDIYAFHESPLWYLLEDLACLTKWAHKALTVIRDQRLGRGATSAFPTLPPPAKAPKTPTTRLPSPPATVPSSSPAPEERPKTSAPDKRTVLFAAATATPKPPTPNPTATTISTVSSDPAPTPTSTSVPKPPHLTAPSASDNRLIVRYPDNVDLTTRPRPQPSTIVQTLNRDLCSALVSAISYSRHGRLVLHTKDSRALQQLGSKRDVIHRTLQKLFGLDANSRPTLETGDAWSKVVIHGVPTPGSGEIRLDISTYILALCDSNGVDPTAICQIRPLCSRDDVSRLLYSPTPDSPDSFSMLLCLSDDATAVLLQRYGVTWFSAHCRVTPYRPQRRHGTSRQSD
ncbi:hypothetical protein EXIGLDRAFT_695781 [Exidia glandulosa HHB12029]|uniref:Uncharacterized protein n=1 Tax=Exidia glandulosa HHB12029 TaxID=1314781 RepID=A0A165FMM8_EXIGL|nr:hypothetical protein EXIGLDRAFT_695781 [Exidia glandulosa HHB12029]